MKRVLLVDDSKSFLNALSYYLKSHNIEVSFSYSVDEALNEMEQQKFDLICSDYNMGDKDGLYLLKYIRTKKDKTKFIMLTGNDSSELQQEVNKLDGLFLDKGNFNLAKLLLDEINKCQKMYFCKM